MALLVKARDSLLDLFRVQRLDHLARDTDKCVFKAFRWIARLFMAFYVAPLPVLIVRTLLAPSYDSLMFLVLWALVIPLGYRFSMRIQIKFHSLY